MTDRQAFPFDGAGDFKGWWVGVAVGGGWRVESQSRRDDPAACERLCVCVCVPVVVFARGCHQEG